MKSKIFAPLQIILMVLGATMVRTFLENFSNPEPAGGFTSFALVVNYFLYYLVVVLSIGIVMGVASRQSWIKMISRVTYFLPIIWIVPIIDSLFSGGACLAYISSTGWNLVRDIVNFFTGPFTTCGISLGLRVEFIFILVGSGLYIFKKTQSYIRAILGALGIFLAIMLHSAIPGIIMTIAGTPFSPNLFFQEMFARSLLGTTHTLTNATGTIRYLEQIAFFMGRIPWLMIVGILPILFWKESPQKFKAFFKNARVTRVVYYGLILIAGSAVAVHQFGITIPHALPDILAYLIALVCVCLSCWLGVAINDLADQDLDRINAADRPLITKALSTKDMQSIGWVTGTLIVTGAILVNWNFFVLIAMWQIAYAVYSLPPYQMKRHWILSSLLVGIAGIAFALAGYFLVAPNQSFTSLSIVGVAMTWFTLAILSNTKDFKDVRGDRELGIKTLPAVYGSRRAGAMLMATLLVWICVAAYILRNEWIVVLTLPWIILDVILRKRVPEYVRFIIVYFEIIALLFFLFR